MDKFTLGDGLVQLSLKALSCIDKYIDDLKPVLVGGIAVQIYSVSPKFYRPTNDIDVLTFRRIPVSEFKREVAHVIGLYLNAFHYDTASGKTRYGYEVSTNDNGELFFIHLSNFTDAYRQRHGEWKKREIDNAKLIEIPGIKNYCFRVHRIEDILANKARRIGKLEREGYMTPEQEEEILRFRAGDFEKLGSVNLAERLDRVVDKRAGLLHIGKDNFNENVGLLNRYKITKDLYDVALLSRTIIEGKEPLDLPYLKIAMSAIAPKAPLG